MGVNISITSVTIPTNEFPYGWNPFTYSMSSSSIVGGTLISSGFSNPFGNQLLGRSTFQEFTYFPWNEQGGGNTFSHNMFNLWGSNPFVKHFKTAFCLGGHQPFLNPFAILGIHLGGINQKKFIWVLEITPLAKPLPCINLIMETKL